jgi:hypothetical protein
MGETKVGKRIYSRPVAAMQSVGSNPTGVTNKFFKILPLMRCKSLPNGKTGIGLLHTNQAGA